MNVTAQLKELILSRYKSLRAFAEDAGIAYTTIDTVLKKGVLKAGIGTVLKVCKSLGISADKLGEGEIVSSKQLDLSPDEVEMVERYRELDEQSRRVIRNLVHVEYEETLAERDAKLKSAKQTPENPK